MDIDKIRQSFLIKKADIYSDELTRNKLDRVFQNSTDMSISTLLELSNILGINHFELMNLCGLSINDLKYQKEDSIDTYRIKCINIINQEDCAGMVEEITYLENNDLVFLNPKYINIWLVLKLSLHQFDTLGNYKQHHLQNKDVKLITAYYKQRRESPFVITTGQDIQILSNILSSKSTDYEETIKLSNVILSDHKSISNSPDLYDFYMLLTLNAFNLAYIQENFAIYHEYKDYFNKIKPEFPENKVRLDLTMSIKALDNIFMYLETKNLEFYLTAINYRELLLDFGKSEALYTFDDILEALINNDKNLLAVKENYFINRGNGKELQDV